MMHEILKNVWLFSFLTRQDLALTFLRFQEHYESPRFRGEVFSMREFETWYIDQKGNFSYVEDWSGFNVPSYVFEPFLQGKFDPLSNREQRLLNTVKSIEEPFYVIGTNDRSETLDHEICHALFYVDTEYRDAVVSILEPMKEELREVFSKMLELGYHESVVLDEVHAYLSANPDWLESKQITFDPTLSKRLQDLKTKAIVRNKR